MAALHVDAICAQMFLPARPCEAGFIGAELGTVSLVMESTCGSVSVSKLNSIGLAFSWLILADQCEGPMLVQDSPGRHAMPVVPGSVLTVDPGGGSVWLRVLLSQPEDPTRCRMSGSSSLSSELF